MRRPTLHSLHTFPLDPHFLLLDLPLKLHCTPFLPREPFLPLRPRSLSWNHTLSHQSPTCHATRSYTIHIHPRPATSCPTRAQRRAQHRQHTLSHLRFAPSSSQSRLHPLTFTFTLSPSPSHLRTLTFALSRPLPLFRLLLFYPEGLTAPPSHHPRPPLHRLPHPPTTLY
jgi:hypothetical protein